MVGTARSRNLSPQLELISGKMYRNGVLWGTRTAYDGFSGQSMQDVIGNFSGVNPLEIISNDTRVARMNGTTTSGGTSWQIQDGPVTFRPSPLSAKAKFGALSSTDLSNFAWHIQANSNPSAPRNVSWPTYVGELKDMPELVRRWGLLFMKNGTLKSRLRAAAKIKTLASGYLTWKWAVRPLVSDLAALLEAQRLTEERLRWVNKLQQGGTIRKRVRLRETVLTDSSSALLESAWASISATRVTRYTEVVWGTCRWSIDPAAQYFYPGKVGIPNDNASKRDFARRLVIGATDVEGLATAWELFPWSWLQDWFLGIGTMIRAKNNSIQLVASNHCVCRTLTSYSTYGNHSGSGMAWVKLSTPHFERQVVKQRFPCAPSLPLVPSQSPLFDPRCWLILGSLGAVRSKDLDRKYIQKWKHIRRTKRGY